MRGGLLDRPADSEEGTQSLEQLRTEARALEGRFGTAVDDLRGLISQRADVFSTRVSTAAGPGRSPHPIRSRARWRRLTGVGEPDAEDADRASLDEDVEPRVRATATPRSRRGAALGRA